MLPTIIARASDCSPSANIRICRVHNDDTLQLNVVSQLFNLRNLIRAEIILGNLNRFDRIAIESN